MSDTELTCDNTELRTREFSDKAIEEGYKSEEIHNLSKRRAGHIGVLTKIYNNISELIKSGKCNVGDVTLQLNKFDKAWCEFVGIHERYLGLLQNETDRQNACASYDEQIQRKTSLDTLATEWRQSAKIKPHGETGNKGAKAKHSKSMRSRSEGSSSRASSISKKREDMALARLKVEQLKIRQEFEIQEQEIKRKKELADAEMEANMAAISYEIYQEEEGSVSGNEVRDEYFKTSAFRDIKEFHEPVLPKNEENKPIFNIEMETIEDVSAVRGSQYKELKDPNKPQNLTNVDPQVPEMQPELPKRYYEQLFSQNKVAPDFQETPLPLELTNKEVKLPFSNPVWAPISNRAPPATLNKEMHRSATLKGSRNPHRINFATPSTSNHRQECEPLIGNNIAAGESLRNVDSQTSPTEELARALRQVVNMPKIEYLHFNGDPLKYGTFMHNFEVCLERDNPDDSRKLQLLIQHCNGKAREAIESCINLPSKDGYRAAKETLHEHFGRPHVIAMAHIKKLMDLPSLKSADGPSLLEFARHLGTAERTLTGMGASYVSDLDHMNTLRELAKKLPMHLRARWTERAGKIIEEGRKAKFEDFQKFIQQRAKLVNNEFGTDMANSMKLKSGKNERSGTKGGESNKTNRLSSFATGFDDERGDKRGQKTSCEACSEPHRIWRCDKFKKMELKERQALIIRKGLCNKCLVKGHIAKNCPKTNFKCRVAECGAQHHTLLHRSKDLAARQEQTKREAKVDKEENGAGDQRQSTSKECNESVAATAAGERRVCLGVIPVRVRGCDGAHEVETYALLDSGSEVTLCHERLMETLNLGGEKLRFTLTGINGSAQVDSQLIDIHVESLDGSSVVELTNVKTVKQLPVSKGCIPKKVDLERWPHLKDIEIPELMDEEVMLLIGLKERPRLFLPLEVREGSEEEPIAIRYSLGWAVMGPVGGMKETRDCLANFARANIIKFGAEENLSDSVIQSDMKIEECRRRELSLDSCMLAHERNASEDDLLTRQLERLWNTDFNESTVDNKASLSVEDKRALEMMEQSLKRRDGHFQVALPWREEPVDIPNNKPMAERRLEYLKRRLKKDSELFVKYKRAMQDYIDKGHAEKVPKKELEANHGKVWYLPHHPVTHRLKPEKVRIVFDCAATYEGQSLNMQLLQGPDLTNSLVGVLIRFREEPVALVADIESMFYQVLVEPTDRDAFRFLWWENNDLEEEPTEYRMVKHVFGATSSPSCANFCLKKTASIYGKEFDREVSETVDKNMYVDDLMKSVISTERAIILAQQLRELLQKGGFKLTKWLSNNREVLMTIPESERASSVVNLNIDDLPTETALGLKWNVEEDAFIWETDDETLVQAQQKAMTRRGVLSVVSSLFDPLGMIAPFIMKAKLLLQELCRKKLEWDDEIDELERKQWLRWLSDLSKLKKVKVERCFKPQDFGEIKGTELHLFSDGSRVGYGAVAYLRLIDDKDRIHCSFILGRARVAPIREITIPRLELSAAVVSVQLRESIQRELDVRLHRVVFWTDSMSVLKSVRNETKRFHTFESNRLTIIHNGSEVSEWRYVKGEDNPADDASRGLKLDELLQNGRWLKGPNFLWKDESEWPESVEAPPITEDDPQVRRGTNIYVAAVTENPMESLVQRYSSWWELVRAFGWLSRFKNYLEMKVLDKKRSTVRKPKLKLGNLKVDELREAERNVVRYVQRTSFPKIFTALQEEGSETTKKNVKRNLQNIGSCLYQLNPMLKDELIVVGGRLQFADIDEETKHPMILPSKHHVTDLVIRHHHMLVGHMGQESVLACLREKFWILKGRTSVRRVIRSCVDCQRRKKPTCRQLMADLPQDRVKAYEPPFTYVGVDFFGPVQVKQRRSRVKRYGCIFTCLNTRAVHIEIAHSLNTDSMLNALRRSEIRTMRR